MDVGHNDRTTLNSGLHFICAIYITTNLLNILFVILQKLSNSISFRNGLNRNEYFSESSLIRKVFRYTNSPPPLSAALDPNN